MDSCLCDACFRHVDRRANCASYKKRLSAPPPTASLTEFETSATDADEKTLQQNPNATASEATLFQSNKEPIACLVAECTRQASHSLRRKWALKLRKTIAKSIAMNFDNTNSQAFLPICDKHCDDIGHMLVCVLCNRKLKTRHSYFINKVRSLTNRVQSTRIVERRNSSFIFLRRTRIRWNRCCRPKAFQ